jgi:ribonuclease P protein component
MSDEAHFPAQQPRPRAPARLPLAQRDAGRPQGAGGTARPRPQEAVGLISGEVDAPELTTLSRRADFLAANSGARAPMPGFVLLMRPRGDGSPAMRVGYTVTKKIGNAVVRNRMKRRFRALARELLPVAGTAGADHVLIGRAGGIERDYDDLRRELAKALTKVVTRSAGPSGGGKQR